MHCCTCIAEELLRRAKVCHVGTSTSQGGAKGLRWDEARWATACTLLGTVRSCSQQLPAERWFLSFGAAAQGKSALALTTISSHTSFIPISSFADYPVNKQKLPRIKKKKKKNHKVAVSRHSCQKEDSHSCNLLITYLVLTSHYGMHAWKSYTN